MLAVLPLALSSCHDDNDLPDVDFHFEFSGASVVDGTIYVVQGETFKIESITVTNNEQGKGAMITGASYYWDGYYLGASIEPPYGFEIEVDDQVQAGFHSLEVTAPLYAVDKEVATSLVAFKVKVVEGVDEIPAEGTTGYNVTPSVSDK